MGFSKDDVRQACVSQAPKFQFDPLLIFALCLQEGQQSKSGEFEPSVARLEQGYYRRYVERLSLATSTEILLSASYGVTQMMGLSLKEAGFFGSYFAQLSFGMQDLLKEPLSQLAVPTAVDAYCVKLDWQIEWGCRWLAKKRTLANGDTVKMLSLWNGDMTGKYATEVLEKYKKVQSG